MAAAPARLPSSVRFCVAIASLAVMGWAAAHSSTAKLADPPAGSVLRLSIIDQSTGRPTSARIELLDEQRRSYCADDALLVGGDCRDRPAAWQGTLDEWRAQLTHDVNDPHSGTNQFYCDGTCRVSLPPGNYALRVFKGNEYRVASQKFRIAAGVRRGADRVLDAGSTWPARAGIARNRICTLHGRRPR